MLKEDMPNDDFAWFVGLKKIVRGPLPVTVTTEIILFSGDPYR